MSQIDVNSPIAKLAPTKKFTYKNVLPRLLAKGFSSVPIHGLTSNSRRSIKSKTHINATKKIERHYDNTV